MIGNPPPLRLSLGLTYVVACCSFSLLIQLGRLKLLTDVALLLSGVDDLEIVVLEMRWQSRADIIGTPRIPIQTHNPVKRRNKVGKIGFDDTWLLRCMTK